MLPNDSSPLVIIGLKDVYDQVIALRASVQTLLYKQSDLEIRSADHEARIRALEKNRWPIPALSVVISLSSIGVAVVALLGK